MDLLYLLGLLPGGISAADLDLLWGKVTQQSRKMHLEAKGERDGAGPNQAAMNVSMNQLSQRSRAGGPNQPQESQGMLAS